MKKLLSILGAIGITALGGSSFIACNPDESSGTDDSTNTNTDEKRTLSQIIKKTDFGEIVKPEWYDEDRENNVSWMIRIAGKMAALINKKEQNRVIDLYYKIPLNEFQEILIMLKNMKEKLEIIKNEEEWTNSIFKSNTYLGVFIKNLSKVKDISKNKIELKFKIMLLLEFWKLYPYQS